MVRRVFVEKRSGFAVEAQMLKADLRQSLNLPGLNELRIFKRYDVEGLDAKNFMAASQSILSEPNCDNVYFDQMPQVFGRVFAVEYLPGQYDQRADSAAQCIQIISQGERPTVRAAKIYMLYGDLTEKDVTEIILISSE